MAGVPTPSDRHSDDQRDHRHDGPDLQEIEPVRESPERCHRTGGAGNCRVLDPSRYRSAAGIHGDDDKPHENSEQRNTASDPVSRQVAAWGNHWM
jgi:hypothetical protein